MARILTANNVRNDKRSLAGSLVVAVLLAGAAFASAQNTNQITAVSPSSAAQGTSGVVVTFTLDIDVPPPPPAGVMPNSVRIGTLTGTAVTHSAQATVTAMFTIPGGEATGVKDVTITFSTPNGTVTFSRTAGFAVTSGANTAPTISQQPLSQSAPPGAVVTFSIVASGTPMLSYQWQKNTADIDGATAATYTISAVTKSDGGSYRCIVTNNYGSATSDAATLIVAELPTGRYPIVDTGQTACYGETVSMICPSAGQNYAGQDAQYIANFPSYALSSDGLCVFDNVTGLTWQRSPDTNRDGTINVSDKLTLTQARALPATLNAEQFGGYSDWRLPTIKELYSLVDFTGMDPTACTTEAACPGLKPFINRGYFQFAYGDTSAGERVIDSQYASSDVYVSTVDEQLLFGVNFADGRIKGYGLLINGSAKTFFVTCVRGNPDYGVNNFVDLGDGTIFDRATGLEWQQTDNGVGVFWKDALAYAEGLTFAGRSDWRLPNVKELQSILDYTRSPDTTNSAAINSRFSVTAVVNEEGAADYPYFWASTTHVGYGGGGSAAAYVAFGRGLGYMNGTWRDVHGAGCQRSDPKSGDPDDYPTGHGPQGDAIRIYNFVRCVRGPFAAEDFNRDGVVNAADLVALAACMEGPEIEQTGTCVLPDLTTDSDADLADFAALQSGA